MAVTKVITPLDFNISFDPEGDIVGTCSINTTVDILDGVETIYTFTKQYDFILGEEFQDDLNDLISQLVATIT